MALPTENQGVASARRHFLDPHRLFTPSMYFEISQFADMMYLDLLLAATKFTRLCKKALEQFHPLRASPCENTVFEDGRFSPSKRKAAEAGYERLFPFPFHLNL